MMASSSSSSILILVTTLVLVTLQPTTLASELLNSVCLPPVDGFTSLSQYTKNLNTLLQQFANVNASDGFDMANVGSESSQHAFGLINCRGDASSSSCRACAKASTKAARILCPGNQGAILWYDDCLLKYTSDGDVLGFSDLTHKFTLSSSVSVSGNVTMFNSRVKGLLNKLINKVADNPKLFAKGKTKADDNTTVYGMVECTRDIFGPICEGDLQDLLSIGFDDCCNGVKGGRYVAATAMFRFQVYPF